MDFFWCSKLQNLAFKSEKLHRTYCCVFRPANRCPCIPVINVFGFVNQTREFPDKRDLNRVFPGSKKGSLASRFAYYLLKEIMPHVDYAIDFHAGGSSRFNAPQIRIVPENKELKALSDIFQAPFGLYSKNIIGSFRNSCDKLGVKMLLFEGGKSININDEITQHGIDGTQRILKHFGMLNIKKTISIPEKKTIYIEKSNWIRAKYSGMFHGFTGIGNYVEKGQLLFYKEENMKLFLTPYMD